MLWDELLKSKILELVAEVSGATAWWAVSGSLILCALGLPLPEEAILIAGGALVARGQLSFFGAVTSGFVGILVGDLMLYGLGRFFDRRLVDWLIRRGWLHEGKFRNAQARFHTFGRWLCVIGRFTPGIRMPVFLAAGVMKMSAIEFLLFDGVAALILTPAWTYVGSQAGSSIAWMTENIKITFICLGLFVLLAVAYRSIRARRS